MHYATHTHTLYNTHTQTRTHQTICYVEAAQFLSTNYAKRNGQFVKCKLSVLHHRETACIGGGARTSYLGGLTFPPIFPHLFPSLPESKSNVGYLAKLCELRSISPRLGFRRSSAEKKCFWSFWSGIIFWAYRDCSCILKALQWLRYENMKLQ